MIMNNAIYKRKCGRLDKAEKGSVSLPPYLKVTRVGITLHVSFTEDASLAHSPRGHQLRVYVRIPPRHD